MRGDVFDALGNVVARGRDSAARHHHAARSPRARGIRRERRVTVNDPHAVRIDAERFVRHLRERRLETLTMRVRADANLERAVRREPRETLLVTWHHRNAPAVVNGRAVSGLLAVNRYADADSAAVRLTRLLPRAPLLEVE